MEFSIHLIFLSSAAHGCSSSSSGCLLACTIKALRSKTHENSDILSIVLKLDLVCILCVCVCVCKYVSVCMCVSVCARACVCVRLKCAIFLYYKTKIIESIDNSLIVMHMYLSGQWGTDWCMHVGFLV